MELDPERLNASWSSFWTTSAVTALPANFPDGYDGAMLDFWREQLDGEFRHIVDLATGNGALAWIACAIQSKHARPARITGVDLADIDPFGALNKPRSAYPTISFLGKTPVDSLPFADGAIDVVVSQYGIEYSDLEKTIAEVARVLAPSGKMCFILHDQESVIIKGTMNKLIHCRDMIADKEFHGLTRQFIEILSRYPRASEREQSSEYHAVRQMLHQKLLQLKPRLDRYPRSSPLNPYIQAWSVFMDPDADLATSAREDKAREALAMLVAGAEKLAEIDAAALTSDDRDRLAGFIRRHGFHISLFGTLEYNDGANWGTRLVAHR